MMYHGSESMFSDNFEDGFITVMEICGECGGNRHTCKHIDRDLGSIPTQEIVDNEEVIDMTNEAIPDYIDPADEITRPMGMGDAINPLGEYEKNPRWDEVTLVEPIQIINRSAA